MHTQSPSRESLYAVGEPVSLRRARRRPKKKKKKVCPSECTAALSTRNLGTLLLYYYYYFVEVRMMLFLGERESRSHAAVALKSQAIVKAREIELQYRESAPRRRP